MIRTAAGRTACGAPSCDGRRGATGTASRECLELKVEIMCMWYAKSRRDQQVKCHLEKVYRPLMTHDTRGLSSRMFFLQVKSFNTSWKYQIFRRIARYESNLPDGLTSHALRGHHNNNPAPNKFFFFGSFISGAVASSDLCFLHSSFLWRKRKGRSFRFSTTRCTPRRRRVDGGREGKSLDTYPPPRLPTPTRSTERKLSSCQSRIDPA